MSDLAAMLGQVLDDASGMPAVDMEGYAARVIQQLAQRGYVITPIKPGYRAVREHPCRCASGRGCIAHPFGPPPVGPASAAPSTG